MVALVKNAFQNLPKNIAACFADYNILWHLLAISLTYLLVTSGFDWFYFQATRNVFIESVGLVPALIGFLVPVIVPIAMYIRGKRSNSPQIITAAAGVAQAEIIGWLISSTYKVFTGRIQPELFTNASTDISREFHFGFFQHGIFWGWPSTHTTVAFAMALALIYLYPKNKKLLYLSLLYALCIGVGVSITIHWFSDFIAGAIIGSVVGMVVGKRFQTNIQL
jgi:membrane-associated phospholipid phosphatase